MFIIKKSSQNIEGHIQHSWSTVDSKGPIENSYKYIKIQQKAYQFKNLARFNDGQKIITKEGQTAIQTFCQAQPLLTALMHFC